MVYFRMTDAQKNLSRKYLIYKVFTNLWFLSAVWLYFYRLYINDQQVGLLDGMAFAIGLLAEVPSGALADKFGRDRLVKLGQILAGTGLLIQAFNTTFLPLMVGQAIMMIGVSFVSGADDALFYENLKFAESSTHWKKLVTRGSQIALLGILFATIVGGILHSVDPRLPWILNGVSFITAALVIWTVKDRRLRPERKNFIPEVKDYLNDILTGFGQFRLPKLWFYVPFIITVQGLFYTTGYGLLRLVLLDRFHFSTLLGSIAVALSSLITVGMLAYLHKHAERFSEKRILTTIGLVAAAGLLLSLADLGLWGFVVILALYAGEYLLLPLMSEILNNQAPEDQRATVLSVASFFRTLPYVFLAPLIGYLNNEGKLEYFFVVWAVLILLAVGLYLLVHRRDTQVNFKN
jgi:MFS family permease